VPVGIERLAVRCAKRVLDHRVLADRHRDPRRELVSIQDLAARAQHLVGRSPGLARERRRRSATGRPLLAMLRLSSGDQHDVGVAARDRGGRASEQCRLEHAHLRHLGARAHRAEALGDEAARIQVVPEAARRGDPIGPGEQRAAARVLRRRLECGDHQLDRLARLRRILLALLHGADPHQYGGARIFGHADSTSRRRCNHRDAFAGPPGPVDHAAAGAVLRAFASG
jgi:hypothetical protein